MVIPPIKVERNLIRLAKAYLGTDDCFVWVGLAYEPTYKSLALPSEVAVLMGKYFPLMPYGMHVGNPSSNGKLLEPLFDEDADGYYELRLELWPEGIYRLNYHGPLDQLSPFGNPQLLNGVSWAWWGPDHVDPGVAESVRDFVYKNTDGSYCFRVLIDRDRSVKPFGNQSTIRKENLS